jgi:hypothetical protein
MCKGGQNYRRVSKVKIYFSNLTSCLSRSGALTFSGGLAALLGPPISGYVLDATNSYGASFTFAGGQHGHRLNPLTP